MLANCAYIYITMVKRQLIDKDKSSQLTTNLSPIKERQCCAYDGSSEYHSFKVLKLH